MSASFLPMLAAFGIVGVTVVLLVVAVAWLPRVGGKITLSARFFCPWVRRNVVLRYRAGASGDPVGVVSCTAFADPMTVTCATRCLSGEGPPGLVAVDRSRLAPPGA